MRETSVLMGLVGLALVGLALRHTHVASAAQRRADHPPELIADSARPMLPSPKNALVHVSAHVEVNGAVSDVRLVAEQPEFTDLEPRALAAVRNYRFKPALKAGASSDDWTTVSVHFGPMPDARHLAIKGSDTIGSGLGVAWARALEQAQPDLQIDVEALGSNTGFAGLLDGTAEIAASSRPIKPEEQALADKLGITLKSVVAAHDGIAVIVNRANTLEALDVAQVANVFAGRATHWNQLGGGTAPIRALGRPPYSGTHGFFRERVLSMLSANADFGPEVESVESSEALVGRVVSDPNAIAYVSLSHVSTSVRTLALRAGREAHAIALSAETVRNGTYPIGRPLMLYYRADASREALAYVELALSPAGQVLVEKSGFVPLADEERSAPLREVTDAGKLAPRSPSERRETHRVYFEAGSFALTETSRQELAALATELKADKRAVLVGNSDTSGGRAANVAVARRRARAVATELRHLGVDGERLSQVVADDDQPLASNDTEEGRRENRRVDVLLFAR